MTEKTRTIITVLNKYMKMTGQTQISAVEAAEYLDKLGILPLGNRKGGALRKLLREGKIPNAIQPGGKNTDWFILYDELYDEIKSKSPLTSVSPTKPEDKPENNFSMGLDSVEKDSSEYLILGTLPSKDSLWKQQYYANSRNRFWPIMSNILAESKLLTGLYDERIAILQEHDIALWDVLKAAEREGSLDANLKNIIVNDIMGFLNVHTSIKAIGLNGKQAQILFHKYIGSEAIPSHIKIVGLKSTSPANAQFSLEEMIKDWKQLFE